MRERQNDESRCWMLRARNLNLVSALVATTSLLQLADDDHYYLRLPAENLNCRCHEECYDQQGTCACTAEPAACIDMKRRWNDVVSVVAKLAQDDPLILGLASPLSRSVCPTFSVSVFAMPRKTVWSGLLVTQPPNCASGARNRSQAIVWLCRTPL